MERTPEGWSRELKNGVYVLTRTFQFGDFAKAMEFAVRVRAAADDGSSSGNCELGCCLRGLVVSRRKGVTSMSRLPRRPTNCTRNAAYHERTSL